MPTRLVTLLALATVGAGLAVGVVGAHPGASLAGAPRSAAGAGSEMVTELAADDPAADVLPPVGGYRLPLTGAPAVLQTFQPPAARWGAGHRGVDLSAAIGEPVLAPADGVVSFAGRVVNRAVITVTHPDGLRSSLEPVTTLVTAGTWVRRGEVIGEVESVAGHCAPAVCLHWGVRRGEVYLDPLRQLPGRGPVVLLPDRD